MKVMEGNPDLIKKVTLDLGEYLGKFERHSSNDNKEFKIRMDTWGKIRQRPRVITIEFTSGVTRTYEHTLHLEDGFMSCLLGLENSYSKCSEN